MENHETMKRLSDTELDSLIASITPTPEIHIPFNRAQKVGFLLGVLYPAFVHHLDMGCGKTGLTLELLHWHFKAGRICRTLVLAPTDEILYGWEDEIRRWGIDLPYLILTGSGKRKWDLLLDFKTGLALTSYMGWSTMVSRKMAVQTKQDGSEASKYVPDDRLLDILAELFDALVLDEMTRGPAYQSNLTFQAIKPISEAAKVRYGLAGRLFGKDPMPVWGQFYLIDHGASFGDSFGLFREVFFKSKRGYFGGIEYKFDNAREDVLYKYLANRSLYYNIDEISDLPEVIRTTRMCYFPDDTEVYYRRCVEEIISQKKNATVMKNTFLRMRQLSSGFVGVALDEEDPDYDDGGTATIEFPDNPKLDLLLELIQQLPENRKAIIYHEFTWSGKKISEALTKAKIKHGWLWGGTKNWTVIKERFNNSPDYRVLLVNWKKGGYGLNLQAANYGFFYESPLSIIDRDQCERRMRRTGQRHPVFITDLVVRNSIDHRILQAHQEGRDLWDDVMRNPELLNRED